jgi:hypothetical protein
MPGQQFGMADAPLVQPQCPPEANHAPSSLARGLGGADPEARSQEPEGKVVSSHVARAAARVHTLISGADEMLTGEDRPMERLIAES